MVSPRSATALHLGHRGGAQEGAKGVVAGLELGERVVDALGEVEVALEAVGVEPQGVAEDELGEQGDREAGRGRREAAGDEALAPSASRSSRVKQRRSPAGTGRRPCAARWSAAAPRGPGAQARAPPPGCSVTLKAGSSRSTSSSAGGSDDALEQAVRGEHGQAGIVHARQADHDPVGALVAGGAAFVAVGQGRLVAVVAVGDQELRSASSAATRSVTAPVSSRRRQRLPSPSRASRAGAGGGAAASSAAPRRGRVGVEQEDLAQVGVGGAQQLETVDLGAGVRRLVGQHDARGEVLEAQQADEAAPRVLAAVGSGEALVDQVERRLGVGAPARRRRATPRAGRPPRRSAAAGSPPGATGSSRWIAL